jgi:hypothetical protein
MDQLRRNGLLGGNAANGFVNSGGWRNGQRAGRGIHHVRGHDGAGDSDLRDGLGADHHASHQFSGSQIWTYHAGDPLRNTQAGAKQHAGGGTCNRQYKTKSTQNVSPNLSTKASSRHGSSREFQGLLQA